MAGAEAWALGSALPEKERERMSMYFCSRSPRVCSSCPNLRTPILVSRLPSPSGWLKLRLNHVGPYCRQYPLLVVSRGHHCVHAGDWTSATSRHVPSSRAAWVPGQSERQGKHLISVAEAENKGAGQPQKGGTEIKRKKPLLGRLYYSYQGKCCGEG